MGPEEVAEEVDLVVEAVAAAVQEDQDLADLVDLQDPARPEAFQCYQSQQQEQLEERWVETLQRSSMETGRRRQLSEMSLISTG